MMRRLVDDVLIHNKERFLLHYNFPPFATGEAKAQRGVGRREIGHGNLAHRALKRMIPAELSLCSSCHFRYSGIKRFLIHGNSLCRNTCTARCWCSDEETGFRYCNGT
jgi:hypothetical protein